MNYLKSILNGLGIIKDGIGISYLIDRFINRKRNSSIPNFNLITNKNNFTKQRPFVVIVGIGGVGSHALMSLLRSGISHFRIIDYDTVSLSSLNRHAFALRGDVGKLKSKIVIEYAQKINPDAQIEEIDDAFWSEYADDYIGKGHPDFVIDCIDDINSKVDWIRYCYNNKIRIISSMGAAGKWDPSLIKYEYLDRLHGDPLAKRIRYQYKKKYNNEKWPKIPCVYSIEKTFKGWSDWQEHQKENVEMYRVNFNERVRTLPVFACLPSAFGISLASRVIKILSNNNNDEEAEHEEDNTNINEKKILIGSVELNKWIEYFLTFEEESRGNSKGKIDLVYEDYLGIVKKFNFVSSISGKKEPKLRFSRWRPFKEPTRDNIVLIGKSEINKLYHVNNETDLINAFGEENVKKVDEMLKSF